MNRVFLSAALSATILSLTSAQATCGTGDVVVIPRKVPRCEADKVCAEHGMRLAHINNTNFLAATQSQFDCLGPRSQAWVDEWNGDEYGNACLVLTTGNQAPGGAINVPESCYEMKAVLCQKSPYKIAHTAPVHPCGPCQGAECYEECDPTVSDCGCDSSSSQCEDICRDGKQGPRGYRGGPGEPGSEGPPGENGPAGVCLCQYNIDKIATVPVRNNVNFSSNPYHAVPAACPNGGIAVGVFGSGPRAEDPNPDNFAVLVQTDFTVNDDGLPTGAICYFDTAGANNLALLCNVVCIPAYQ